MHRQTVTDYEATVQVWKKEMAVLMLLRKEDFFYTSACIAHLLSFKGFPQL